MQGSEAKQTATPVRLLVVLLLSGLLSGAALGCLGQLYEWLFLIGPPEAFRWDSKNQVYRMVELPAMENCFFVARLLWNVALTSWPLGLFGGIVTFLVRLYLWRRAGRLKQATLLWAAIFAIGSFLAVFLGRFERPVSGALFGAVMTMIVSGALFGAVMAMIARPLHKLLGSEN